MSKRICIAIVIACVIHVIAGLFVMPQIVRKQRQVALRSLTVVHLTRVAVVASPRPTPTPRPPILAPKARRKTKLVIHAHSHAASGARARDRGRTRHAARRAPKHAAPREIAHAIAATAPPVAKLAAPAPGNGRRADTGTGSSAAKGRGGAEGAAAAGGGTGTSDNGKGDGTAPCGTIFITRRGPIKTYDGVEHVHVGIQVQLRDGTLTPEVLLPYPLIYKNDAESPFSGQNRNNPNFPTLLQFPPPEINTAVFPNVIQTVLAHTTPEGYTDFGACPPGIGGDGPP